MNIPKVVRDAHAHYKAGLQEYADWLGTLAPIRPLAVVDGWERQADQLSQYETLVNARRESYLETVWQESKGDAPTAIAWVMALPAY